MSSDYSDESETIPKWNELRVYRFVMFCVPILFTFILLFLFYVFYLRPRRVNWSSLRMRTTASSSSPNSLNHTESLTVIITLFYSLITLFSSHFRLTETKT